MWKVVIAAVLSAVFVGALSTVVPVVGWAPYGAAVLVGGVWAGLTSKADAMSWSIIIGAALIGAILYWGLGHLWALYLLIISASVLFATLVVIVIGRPADPLSTVHDSKGHGH